MHKAQNTYKNDLIRYRRRMRYSRKQVARLIGHKTAAMLSRYERGLAVPPLLTALRLEIVYRMPIAFLYRELYGQLKTEVRALEDQTGIGSSR